jgi:hypothetical protein
VCFEGVSTLILSPTLGDAFLSATRRITDGDDVGEGEDEEADADDVVPTTRTECGLRREES